MSAAVPQKVVKRVPEPDKPKSPDERANDFLRGEAKTYGMQEHLETLRAEKARLVGQKDLETAARTQAAYFAHVRDKILAGIEATKAAPPVAVEAPQPSAPPRAQAQQYQQGRQQGR